MNGLAIYLNYIPKLADKVVGPIRTLHQLRYVMEKLKMHCAKHKGIIEYISVFVATSRCNYRFSLEAVQVFYSGKAWRRGENTGRRISFSHFV